MMKNFFLFVLIHLVVGNITAQQKDKTLFKIDGERTYVSEFNKLFKNKNALILEKDFDKDLQLMVDYKLKLKQAKAERLDTLASIQSELETYKENISAPFLTDNQTLENLLKEAYYRTQNKIKASHILVAFKDNDTLKAYQKIKDIETQLQNGASFEKLAVQYSDDKSALKNKGMLGYFNAFRMVYAFENAAYKTPVGQVSGPVKTQFGYHLIKVHNITQSEGKVKVAHIMIAGLGKEKEKKINQVYKKIQNGTNFATLAKEYSDDKGTNQKGGELSPFEKGRLPIEFEKVAFAMTEPNSYSKPFKTDYGWHIIKFIKKMPVAPYNELKEELKNKILKDERGKKPKEIALANLAKQNNLKVNTLAKKVFSTTNVYQMPDENLQNVLFTINDEKYLQKDFAAYLKNKKDKLPLAYFDEFKNEKLKAYVIQHLEDQNEEYRKKVNDFKDGLLIFEVLKNHVWNVPAKEPEKVKAFYKANQQKYKSKGASFEEVKGYVESDYQDKIQKEWIESLRSKSKIKYYKRQVKKLKKTYI